MKTPIVQVTSLSKNFSYPVPKQGKGWLSNLFFPERRTVQAVESISFAIHAGERVAFIGPNGAGKSTTIKMMTGILFPSEGEVRVLDMNPATDRKKLAYHIGTVFGQRSQLLPNLPLTDSFEFFGVMYDLSSEDIRRRTKELVQTFELGDFAQQPVRKLSLGQRMRAEVAASLIHEPQIIFLDEPTIGLDVVAKKSLRDLLLRINQEKKTTIFLTSHDVGDIETLCDRTMVINHGKLIADMPTSELSKQFISEKFISLVPKEHAETFPPLPEGLTYEETQPTQIIVRVDLARWDVPSALTSLLGYFEAEDIDIYNADMESVIRHVYERT
ncbi:ABC transporter [Candidatus Gracilibacteria bacterium CG17_big_fil_post_rev_8_21_14_2_50_48_13]|nr:MAG: ABC transporter [Candidatus Gracilibacteria bacterium CG17_big_fil_post_rev_8_21_14_2_50_48_13]